MSARAAALTVRALSKGVPQENTAVGSPLVTVQPEPYCITKHPQSVTTYPGTAVSFHVETQDPNATYQWQYSTDGGTTWYDLAAFEIVGFLIPCSMQTRAIYVNPVQTPTIELATSQHDDYAQQGGQPGGDDDVVDADYEVVDPEDVEMLADLVMAAANEALRSAAKEKEERMESISGGLNIPGMF